MSQSGNKSQQEQDRWIKKVLKSLYQEGLTESNIRRYLQYADTIGYERGIRAIKKQGVPKQVIQMKNGKIIKIHDSLSHAARSINGRPESVLRVIQGRRHTYKGYQWFYKDQFKNR
jgi:hypothetical protein